MCLEGWKIAAVGARPGSSLSQATTFTAVTQSGRRTAVCFFAWMYVCMYALCAVTTGDSAAPIALFVRNTTHPCVFKTHGGAQQECPHQQCWAREHANKTSPARNVEESEGDGSTCRATYTRLLAWFGKNGGYVSERLRSKPFGYINVVVTVCGSRESTQERSRRTGQLQDVPMRAAGR